MDICIDPGHGGNDSGAMSVNGVREADIVLVLARMLGQVLRGLGHNVALTRWKDVFMSLTHRSVLANLLPIDCFVSLHCNSVVDPRAQGFEIWTAPGARHAEFLAQELFHSIERTFPCRRMRADWSDGMPGKEGRFSVLTRTKAPAVLVELEFLSNVEGEAFLTDHNNQRLAVLAIAEGILKWRRP